jgi:hypothetical protein
LAIEQFVVLDAGGRADAVTGKDAQVHRGQAVGVERTEVLVELPAKIVGILCGQPLAVWSARAADLAHQCQIGGVWVQRRSDQFVGDVRTVDLRGVDVVDTQFNRATQHCNCLVVVTRRPEHAGTRQLHGAEPDASDSEGAQREGLHDQCVHLSRRTYSTRAWSLPPRLTARCNARGA